jgi:hypothetical protein
LSTFDRENAGSGNLQVFEAKPLLLQGRDQKRFLDEMPWNGRGLSAILALNPRIARVSMRVLKFETDVFPSVFECLWVP